MSEFELGDRVTDRDTDDADTAVVVNLPHEPCHNWEAYQRWDGEIVTVADDNPAYDEDEEVIVVAFESALRDAHPEYTAEDPLILAESQCDTYAFPSGRLKKVGEFGQDTENEGGMQEDTEEALTLSDEMDALRQRLEESATVAVDEEDGEPILVVEKLGSSHRIRSDGTVSDGPLADRLRDLVDEYLGVAA